MANQSVDNLVLMNKASKSAASKKGTPITIHSSYMSLIEMINVRGDEFPSNFKFDAYDHCNKYHENNNISDFNSFYNPPSHLKIIKPFPRRSHL